MSELGSMVSSIQTNLVLVDGKLRNNMQPLGCGPVAEVSTILVTRYWVTPDGQHEKPPQHSEGFVDGRLQPDWKLREQLFLDWCLPSVVGQTRPPQAWLILVSDWALEHLSQRLLFQIYQLPYAHLVVVPSGRAHSPVAREWVAGNPELLDPRWNLAFRFDSDDAIARDFLDAAAKWVVRVKPKTPSTLIFPHGVQYDTISKRARLDMHSANHFSGIITQKMQPFLGAFGPNHNEIYDTRDPATRHGVHQANTRWPMWAEILHRANEANHVRPGPLLAADEAFWFDRFNHG